MCVCSPNMGGNFCGKPGCEHPDGEYDKEGFKITPWPIRITRSTPYFEICIPSRCPRCGIDMCRVTHWPALFQVFECDWCYIEKTMPWKKSMFQNFNCVFNADFAKELAVDEVIYNEICIPNSKFGNYDRVKALPNFHDQDRNVPLEMPKEFFLGKGWEDKTGVSFYQDLSD